MLLRPNDDLEHQPGWGSQVRNPYFCINGVADRNPLFLYGIHICCCWWLWNYALVIFSSNVLLSSLYSRTTHSMRKSDCCHRWSCRQEPPFYGVDCEMVWQTCVEWCSGEHQPGWCSLGGMMLYSFNLIETPRWEILILSINGVADRNSQLNRLLNGVANMCGMMLWRASTWLMLSRQNYALEHQEKSTLDFFETNKHTYTGFYK